jgi:benzylsuccinate CoA-transferase BbsE subunit
LSLGGYPDTAPVAVFGNQAYLCGGLMTGVAALLALLGADGRDVPAPRADVSVQATLVGALEDATAEYDLCHTVRRRAGDKPREAGTGIFRSANGYIAMVAGKLGTAQAWRNLVVWLGEEQVAGAEELARPEWTTLEKRREPESLETFTAIFESFSIERSSESLYREGQRRSIAIAPVNNMSDIFSDPQLLYRDFFRSIDSEVFDRPLTVPGRPYRLYDLANFDSWSLGRQVSLDSVLAEWAPTESMSDLETGT